MALLDEIGTLLATNGIGTLGTDIFKAFMPANVADASVVIYETGGSEPEYVHDNQQAELEKPSFQVLVRGPEYDVAKATADTIWKLLAQQRNTVLSGVKYLSIKPIQSPFPLGVDENERFQIVANYSVLKEVVL